MKLQLTDEQIMIRDMIREFARSEIEPYAQSYNDRSEYPEKIIRRLGELGLFGMMVPEAYGGSGAGAVSYTLALREIAFSCASVAVTLSVTNLTTDPIMNFGTDEQKRTFLYPIASGEHVGAFALTEPESGSDPSSLRAKAVKKGKSYIVNGSKQFITNGTHAGLFILIARTSQGKNGLTAFLVPAGTKGIIIGTEEKKMGLCASSTVEVLLEDCEVSEKNVLGRPGMGPRDSAQCARQRPDRYCLAGRGHDRRVPARVDRVRLRAPAVREGHYQAPDDQKHDRRYGRRPGGRRSPDVERRIAQGQEGRILTRGVDRKALRH